MAKRIVPSVEELVKFIRYDPDTGKLFWRVREASSFSLPRHWKRHCTMFANKEGFTHSNKDGYKTTCMFGGVFFAHRVAWAIYYGEWPEFEVDHINCDRSDNRISNLREASRMENSKNRRLDATSTSGLKGASWRKDAGRWIAQISINGKKTFLGYHATAESAHEAYKRAAVLYHGEFARFE